MFDSSPEGSSSNVADMFPGDSEMAQRCRALDWSSTPLGPVSGWSRSLRTAAALILESPHPMFLWWGPDLVQIYNDAYRPSFGAEGRHPDALGMRGRECWPDIWPTIGPQIDQVMAGGPATWHRDQYLPIERNRHLEDVWWTYAYSAVRDDDGLVGGTLVVCQETTDRVRADSDRERAESALRDSEARYKTLYRELEVERARLAYAFQQAPSFLAVMRGEHHVFTLVNDAYYQLVGHRDIVGKPVWEALPEVRGQGFESLLDNVLATGEPFIGREIPFTVARKPGEPAERRFVDLTYMPLVEGDGTRAGIIAHGVDVTDQVRARRDVERLLAESERARAEAEAARADAEAARREADAARRSAETADRAKAEFLATMSHELRTPLNAIGGYAELLEMGIRGPTTEDQRHDLGRIQQSQRHLLGLVNEVLDLAKIDAGGLVVERAEVRAGDTVDAALALVRPQAAAKSLVISDACGGAADRPYLGDEPRVRQVLVNLLANAIKFTPGGGRVTVECAITDRPPITVPVPPGAPCIAVRVEDTGVGIAADQRERIFEPFTQAEENRNTYTRASGGTGLGLTISRRLARLMGGDITVQSTVGSGSTFTLWLPTPERRASPRRQSAEVSGEALRQKVADAVIMAAGLAEIGEALASDAARVSRAWVSRLRADASVPDDGISDQELEDHVSTLVTDIGLALRALGDTVKEPAEVLRDSRAIISVVAERHGAQRARLGWAEGVVMRECALLREVLDGAVRRKSAPSAGAEVVERAHTVVAQLLAQAERVSLGGLRLAGGAEPTQ